MKIVILGGGFGGLKLARALAGKTNFEVLLIDKFNYHQFQPLFYQVATAGLDASNISFPLRKVFHNVKNFRFCMAEVQQVLPESKEVLTDVGKFGYDKLVIATGAGTNFFGNRQMESNAFPMKSTPEALQIRHKLLHNFEDASRTKEVLKRKRLLTTVIVGGGPTGVELSGAIADMRRFVLPKDFPELDFAEMKIYLVEGMSKLLNGMSEKSSKDALKYLENLGVIVLLNQIVKEYNGDTVILNDGTRIESKMVIWAAGIRGNVPLGINPNIIVRGNRIQVNREMEVMGLHDVYALGDIAFMEEPAWPKGHPQVAPVAIQQAALLARNLVSEGKGILPKQFSYKDKGVMATVGRNLAVVDVPKPKLHFKGFIAWFIWMSLHLMLILGVKNRFFVFWNWVYNYFTKDQNLRLIFKEFYRDSAQNIKPVARELTTHS